MFPGARVSSKLFKTAEWLGPIFEGNRPAGLAFASTYLLFSIPVLVEPLPPWTVMLVSVGLAAALVTLSVIDVNSQRLPDRLTFPLTAAGLLLSILFQWGNPAMRLAAAVVGYALMYAIAAGYERLRQRPGLGLGDAKLFAAAGAWLGFEGLPTVMLLATGTALCVVLSAALLGKKMTPETRIPLGPFLAFAFWLVWLYGPLR